VNPAPVPTLITNAAVRSARVNAPHIDLLAADFYVNDARNSYAWMRTHAPVSYDEANDLWGVATYAGVMAVGRDPETFSSAGGSRPDTGPMPWMIDLDAPEHLKRRKLVSRGFTPARVRATREHLGEICDDLVDRVCERGECDFVHDLAAPLPMIVIGDMLGIPASDRSDLLRWSDDMLRSLSGDPESLAAAAAAFGEFNAYARRMIATRREAPTDDLVSVLVHAEVDGARLTDDEIVMETLLLLVGGDETTRHVTTGGMLQLLAEPDTKARLTADLDLLPNAVEEMLRWVTPIKNMARTTTRAVDVDGVSLPPGAKLVVLYESANFDETQFTEPDVFDIERAPNDHLAFGFGAHFCLGASLARLELVVMLERVLRRLPDLELATDEPPRPTINGVDAMPVAFRATAPLRR
jgi:cytochrome P450 family 142 subfamily A polypeptide 1